jgi:hypothetical protein
MATDAIAALAGVIGLLVGTILGFNGFSQPATPSLIGQSPRIKNLLWLLSGFFAIFIADFKKLGLPADLPLAWPFVAYGFGAFLGVVSSVMWMVRSITKTVRAFNAQHRAHPLDPGAFQREYLTYGKTRYEELWNKEKGEAVDLEEKANALELEAGKQRQIVSDADKMIAACVYASLAHIGLTPSARRQAQGALIDTIMAAALNVVRLHSSEQLTLRGSYMAYTTDPSAAPALRMRALFTGGMPSSYKGFLELRRGGGLAVREVVLPVALNSDAVLPGAPEAVGVLGPAIMNIRDIAFRPAVVQSVQDEIVAFFRDPYFGPIASITSLVIFDGGTVHGVMNIESSAVDLLGQNGPAMPDVLARLQILVALLSIFH